MTGERVVVVGGALRTAEDYMPLAHALGGNFEVHVLQRRGRPGAPPMDGGYSIAAEVSDLLALVRQTGATRVFGHSFGGLVALEAAAVDARIERLALYEPALSVDQSIPTAWLDDYAALLAAGDRRGAFARFVAGSGHAPAVLGRLPLWYVKLVLRVAIRGAEWRAMDPLLEANLREHRELAALDSALDRYEHVAASILILVGAKSPTSLSDGGRALRTNGPILIEEMRGLGHDGPDREDAEGVGRRLAEFFEAPS